MFKQPGSPRAGLAPPISINPKYTSHIELGKTRTSTSIRFRSIHIFINIYLYILTILTTPTAQLPDNQGWHERDLDSMNERLQNLMTTIRSATPSTTNIPRPTADNGSSTTNVQPTFPSSPPAGTLMEVDGTEGPITLAGESFPGLPPGWRTLSEKDGWRPTPIGTHVSAVSAAH